MCNYVWRDDSKIKRKKKVFSYDLDHYDVVNCCWNLNFEKMDTASYTGKNDGFWLMWGIFKEYITQNIITAVLGKANVHSVVIFRLIKNQ